MEQTTDSMTVAPIYDDEADYAHCGHVLTAVGRVYDYSSSVLIDSTEIVEGMHIEISISDWDDLGVPRTDLSEDHHGLMIEVDRIGGVWDDDSPTDIWGTTPSGAEVHVYPRRGKVSLLGEVPSDGFGVTSIVNTLGYVGRPQWTSSSDRCGCCPDRVVEVGGVEVAACRHHEDEAAEYAAELAEVELVEEDEDDPTRPLGDKVGCLSCGFSYDPEEGHDCPFDDDQDDQDDDDPAAYEDRSVECTECEESRTATISAAYEDGELALLECARCHDETDHVVLGHEARHCEHCGDDLGQRVGDYCSTRCALDSIDDEDEDDEIEEFVEELVDWIEQEPEIITDGGEPVSEEQVEEVIEQHVQACKVQHSPERHRVIITFAVSDDSIGQSNAAAVIRQLYRCSVSVDQIDQWDAGPDVGYQVTLRDHDRIATDGGSSGGDQCEERSCPFCGLQLLNTHLPEHLQSCSGTDDEDDDIDRGRGIETDGGRAVPPAATGAGSWRFRCPGGHTALESIHGGSRGYYCESCEESYETDPIDLLDDSSDLITDGGEQPSEAPVDMSSMDVAARHLVERLAEQELLTEQQAAAYVSRRIEELSREEAAEELEISKSGVDNALRAAETKIEEARDTIELLEQIEQRTEVSDDE